MLGDVKPHSVCIESDFAAHCISNYFNFFISFLPIFFSLCIHVGSSFILTSAISACIVKIFIKNVTVQKY